MQLTLLLSVVAPAVVATLLVAIGHQLWRRPGPPVERGRWSLSLAPVAGSLAAFVAVKGRLPELPPTSASEWPLWMGALAAVYGLLVGSTSVPTPARWAARVAGSGATAYLVLAPLLGRPESAGAAWIVGGAVALVGIWSALESCAEVHAGVALPLALTVWATAVATTLGLTGSALLAQAAGGLVTALGVVMVASLLRPELRWARSGLGPVVLTLGGLVLAGVHWSDLPAASAALLGAGAALLALFRLPRLQLSGLGRTLAMTLLTAALGGAAVAVGVSGAAEEAPVEDGYDDGYDDGYGY